MNFELNEPQESQNSENYSAQALADEANASFSAMPFPSGRPPWYLPPVQNPAGSPNIDLSQLPQSGQRKDDSGSPHTPELLPEPVLPGPITDPPGPIIDPPPPLPKPRPAIDPLEPGPITDPPGPEPWPRLDLF